jgi:hypothetical protein
VAVSSRLPRKERAENVKLALAPGRVVEGRVTYADTGKPAAGARVMIESAGGGRVRGQTDKDGRYHLNARPSAQFPDGGAPPAPSGWPSSSSRRRATRTG